MSEQQIIKTLTESGGKLWEQGGKRRIYFNGRTIATLGGFEVQVSKSGGVAWANLNGKRISNSAARNIWYAINSGKFWYDLTDGQWYSQLSYVADRNQVIDQFFGAVKHLIEE